MIKSILVATDGSAMAMKAAEYAVGLAKQTGAGLIAVSVIDQGLFVTQSISGEATPTHLIEPVEDYLRQVAAGYLESIKRMCRDQKIKVRTVTRSGYPIEEIIKEAEVSDADLIVVGSHGRSALAASVLGSVAYGVIHRETKIPVLVVRR